jgi:hypothetical protein
MKCLTKVLSIATLSLVLSFTIAHAKKEVKHSGFLGDYSQLTPGSKGQLAERYIKDGVDFKKYKKVMMDQVMFYLNADAEDKGINPDEMKELADKFHKAVVKALGDAYPMVEKPGPDVMRVRVAITDLQSNKPVLSGITTIVPAGLAISIVKKGITGKHTGVGEVSMEVELLDSETDERLAAGVDRRAGGKLKGVKKWGSAEQAFDHWAKKLRTRLDEFHGK